MNRLFVTLFSIFIALVVVVNSFYILDQRKTALVIQLGKSVDYVTEPGLKFKLPFIQDVVFFDKRIHNLAADTTEVIASDQKTMRVDAFAKYRIIDGLKFYETVKDDRGFKLRLAPILDSSLRQVLGSVPFTALLTSERPLIMRKIREIVAVQAKDFGVEVVDVRIMRGDLPDKSRDAVYDRMKSEREKEAKEIRAQGAEQAQKIIATADRDKQILLAEANEQSQITKGRGDADAIKIFSAAFNLDPEFYDFMGTLKAYKGTISKDNTRIIFSTDNEFFKYLKKVN